MVVVAVPTAIVMMLYLDVLHIVAVMRDDMQQNIKTALFARADGNNRHAEHFRQAMQVNIHAALFDNIHHVEGYDERLPKLNELQDKIEFAQEKMRQ